MSTTHQDAPPVRYDVTLIGDGDLHLFNEGTHTGLFARLGAHPIRVDGVEGTHFAVWAPNAEGVSVIGDLNGWDPRAHPLGARGQSGIWEGFVPAFRHGSNYKFHVVGGGGGFRADKTDPFAAAYEVPPKTASIVWNLAYDWGDGDWMSSRAGAASLEAPITTYEVHLGSWMRDPADPTRFMSYGELAPRLAEYCTTMGFTHIELMPITEHPFYGSWGYQTTGYFAPTARYGTPQEFMAFVDLLHRAGIGVILDWVPSHFPTDDFALANFDGTHLYEHADPRKGFHPDWNSYIFNYGRNEVRAFLTSSAMHWLTTYHVDGLRVDAVASMLYLDYSRKAGEWIPNEHGGRENLEAIGLLKHLNGTVYAQHPDVQTVAEESTSWPMVSRPIYVGGLGFGFKWDMGWMHDTLEYFHKEPIHRRWHHNLLTFRNLYAWNENFVLPLSHDEVVHGKGSLFGKMPGDDWQRFANLRAMLAHMWCTPGKKLLFMGDEFGQAREWNHDQGLDWHLLDSGPNAGLQRLVGDLNALYRNEPALHRLDASPDGFEWVDANDNEACAISYLRRDREGGVVLVVCNFTPVVRQGYLVGVPVDGFWREVLNTDSDAYGGGGVGNMGGVDTLPFGTHGRDAAVSLTLPPLGVLVLRPGER
jgi:1,4-alpha-glucan branching enzyme